MKGFEPQRPTRPSERRALLRGMVDLVEVGWFVVNVATGYVAERALEPVLDPTFRALKAVLLPLYDPALAAVRLNLQEHVARERAKDQEFSERLERSMRAGEPAALVAHFVREAAQGTTEERMRMLAAAAAGVFVPEMESEMRSRVARAVAQLEPTDVGRLRNLGGPFAFGGSSESVARSLGASRGALESRGCILVRQKDEDLGREFAKAQRRGGEPRLRTIARVTDVGSAVLRALHEWAPASPRTVA